MNSKDSNEFRGMNSLRVMIFLHILQSDENSSKRWIDYVNDENSSKRWINYANYVMRDELSSFHHIDEFSSGWWISIRKISFRQSDKFHQNDDWGIFIRTMLFIRAMNFPWVMNFKHSDEFRGMSFSRVMSFHHILKFYQSDKNSSKRWINYAKISPFQSFIA